MSRQSVFLLVAGQRRRLSPNVRDSGGRYHFVSCFCQPGQTKYKFLPSFMLGMLPFLGFSGSNALYGRMIQEVLTGWSSSIPCVCSMRVLMNHSKVQWHFNIKTSWHTHTQTVCTTHTHYHIHTRTPPSNSTHPHSQNPQPILTDTRCELKKKYIGK